MTLYRLLAWFFASRIFLAKYPYHFEDLTNDYPESSQIVASRFAKKQIQLMNQGMTEKEAFSKVEKDFLREMNTITEKMNPKPVRKDQAQEEVYRVALRPNASLL